MNLFWGILGLFILGVIGNFIWEFSKYSKECGLCGCALGLSLGGAILNLYHFDIVNIIMYWFGFTIILLIVNIITDMALKQGEKDLAEYKTLYSQLSAKTELTLFEQIRLKYFKKKISKLDHMEKERDN